MADSTPKPPSDDKPDPNRTANPSLAIRSIKYSQGRQRMWRFVIKKARKDRAMINAMESHAQYQVALLQHRIDREVAHHPDVFGAVEMDGDDDF